jgi:hypothetical protein
VVEEKLDRLLKMFAGVEARTSFVPVTVGASIPADKGTSDPNTVSTLTLDAQGRNTPLAPPPASVDRGQPNVVARTEPAPQYPILPNPAPVVSGFERRLAELEDRLSKVERALAERRY